MNAPKFTPGPWMVQNAKDVFTTLGAPNAEGLFAESNDGWQIADCGAGITFIGDIEHELSMTEQSSNARLIAAAPELYEALERICEAHRRETPLRAAAMENAYTLASAVLAKAVQP